MLIKFDSVPNVVSKVYIIAVDANTNMDYVVKFAFTLSNVSVSNLYPNPTEYSSFKVPFTDLSLLSNISKVRMRALFSRPTEVVFTINMHPFFEGAASEDPKIGTVEDWFIINTISESHPMHFHIVNFQVIEELSLKVTLEGCTLYELDYFRESLVKNFQIADNAALCYYLGNMTEEIMEPLWSAFDRYLL
jgi:FtsP/CotA-like multicopper oxidase with cupredoxin domain